VKQIMERGLRSAESGSASEGGREGHFAKRNEPNALL